MMETFYGMVRTPAEAIRLFEACRLGILPRVQRRLSEKERQCIRSGSVFVWDEQEAGMRRWTDGKSWSASRVAGSFLTYKEMEGKRGNGYGGARRHAGKTPDSSRGSDQDQDDGEPDAYDYKPGGLMKQSFSITTSDDRHLHLISYYTRNHSAQLLLPVITNDPEVRRIIPPKGLYPESSLNDAPVPGLARPAMHQPPRPALQHQPPTPQQHRPLPHRQQNQQQYHHQQHQHQHQQQQQQQQQQQPPLPPQGYPPQYTQPGHPWPPSPVAAHSYGHGYYPIPVYSQPQLPPLTHPSQPHYGPPQQPVYQQAPTQSPHERVPLPPLTQLNGGPLHPKSGVPPAPHNFSTHSPRAVHMDSPGPHHSKPYATEAGPIDPRVSGPNAQGPLPAPSQTPHNTPPVASPPPGGGPLSPPRSSHSEANGTPSNADRTSISAILLHPTPVKSEPSSATSSPRAGVGGSANNAAGGGQTQQVRLCADNRAVNVLNKKFCA